jgi:hypothetical protein
MPPNDAAHPFSGSTSENRQNPGAVRGEPHARTPRPSSPHPGCKRLLAATLVPVMGAGCLVLWIGIPLAWLRIASWLSDTGPTVLVVVLVGCPITMVVWGWALSRLHNVYLQLTGQERPLLEAMLVVSVLLALAAITIWFFAFAPGQHAPTGLF